MLTTLTSLLAAVAFGTTIPQEPDSTIHASPPVTPTSTPQSAPRAASTAADHSRPAGPRLELVRVGLGVVDTVVGRADDGSPAQRRRAVEHSQAYYTRLTIHRYASFATVPLFVTEYILGDKLYNGNASGSTRSAHQAVATGIGVLFGVNTITGVWNLWDTRNEEVGRARRITHAVLMLASDAGFVATAALAPEGEEGEFERGGEGGNRSTHRAVAISSMGVSLASYLMMYLWKN